MFNDSNELKGLKTDSACIHAKFSFSVAIYINAEKENFQKQ
jgi:hypothetical protein